MTVVVGNFSRERETFETNPQANQASESAIILSEKIRFSRN